MVRITPKDIAKITGGKLVSGKGDAPATGFSIDSRTISPGDIFIAVKGRHFDGHDFIGEALEKGASGLILQKDPGEGIHGKATHVMLVDDTQEAMGRVASWIRRRVDIPVICITGTNGKTTVKDLLSHVLSSRYKVLGSRRSYNNIIGLSLTLFDLDPSHEVAVLGVGTNHPGEIPKLAGIAGPNIAVITNIGDGHLEAFEDREGVFAEKISLLEFLPETGMVFLNKDDSLLARASVRGVTRKFYGISRGSDFLISDVSRKENGYEFRLNGERYFTPLEGEHNVHNAAVSAAVAVYFGISPEEIRMSFQTVSPPAMRLEKVEAEEITFINDSYNANPDSFERALDVLESVPGSRVKGVVAGDMMELGERSDEFHRMIGRSIHERGIDFLITLGGRAWHMAEGALDSGMAVSKVLRAQTHEDAAEMVREMAAPGAVVLLKGSREARMEEVLKCFTISCTH
jgi:UDP-N-acetylmuramoyl-tripeptide--D-alanyl-D-alanine ligase